MTKTFFSGITISDALKPGNNNFDLLRVLAACLSIWGHAYAISPKDGMREPLLQLLKTEYSGSVSIAILFFVSGLLVVDSYQRVPNALLFLASRAGRVMPGLLVCLLASILVIGPIFTRLDLHSYFTNPSTLLYYTTNASLIDIQWHLPGVFESSVYGFNGSFWSFPVGVRLYLAVALLGVLGIFRFSLLATLVLVALFMAGIFFPEKVPYFLELPLNVKAVAPFLLGALLAANKQAIRLTPALVVAAIAIAWLGLDSEWGKYLLFAAFFIALLYLFTRPACCAIGLPGNYCYGIYIYGFPVQQIVAHLQPSPHPWVNAAFSLPIAIGLGAVSWHFVEKPAWAWVKQFAAGLWNECRNWRQWLVRYPGAPRVAAVVAVFLLPLLLAELNPAAPRMQSYGERRIVRYGPATVKAGQVFNGQANGEAAIWLNLDAEVPLDGTVAIGGVRLMSVRNGTMITAVVPKPIYAAPGELPVWVEYSNAAGAKVRTPEVSLKIE